MERCVRAIFYDYKYYLLPDGKTVGDIINGGACTLTRLKEEKCMAPDFVYDSMAEEDVEFTSPERAVDTSVNLYTQEEYDAILLGQVRKVCPGCTRYSSDGPDDTSLEGHHREISLNGLCYEREEDDAPKSFAFLTGWFLWNVYKMLPELSECIDKNNQKKLNKLLNDKLTKISYPLRFYGGVSDGKYCLCISPDRALPYSYNNIAAYIAAFASQKDNELYQAGWQVLPYFKKGVFRYDGKKSFENNSPALYLEPAGFPFEYTVVVYVPNADKLTDKKKDALLSEVHDRLREAIGEDREIALIEGYELGGEQDKAKSLDEVVSELNAAYNERVPQAENAGDIFPYSIGFASSSPEPKIDAYPYRESITEGATCAFDITLCPLDDPERRMWWTDFFDLAYFVIPLEYAQELAECLPWYMTNFKLVPEPIGDPDNAYVCAMGVGSAESDGILFLDNIVFDENEFLKRVRILSPLFEGKDVKLIIVSEGKIREYKCGFDMTLIKESNI